MDKLDTYENEAVLDDKMDEKNPALENSLIVYEDKSPTTVEIKEGSNDKKANKQNEKSQKKVRGFGITSFAFSIFSLFAVMIMGIPLAIGIFTHIIPTLASLISPFLSLLFLIVAFLIGFGLLLLTIPSSIIGLIFASVDKRKNQDGTFLGNMGHTTSFVSLMASLASFVVLLILYIIPLILSVILQIFKTVGLAALISNFIVPLFQ